MKRTILFASVMMLGLACVSATARGHKTPLSGTWDCVSHGGAQGDMKFTLYLQESKEVVDGKINSPLGSTDITSGALRRNELELHFDLPQGSYTLMGHLDKDGKIIGGWSLDSDKGSWEATKRGD